MDPGEADVDPFLDILPAPVRPKKRTRWVVLGLVVVIALVAGGVFLVTQSDGDEAPKAWDPRIADFVAYVERERGLTFEHPVQTEFLSDAAFREKVTDNGALTDEDKDEIHHFEGLFRALGLVEGDIDLLESMNKLTGESVIGLYDPDAKSIYVRGDTITLSMRPTIVHELTHALQDQRFGLDFDLHPSGADSAFRALVEADAMRIEELYEESLPENERRDLDAAKDEQIQNLDLEGIPPILTELFQMPYILGPPFVEALVQKNGAGGVDKAFERKPTTEEQIADPEAYFREDHASKVPTPKLKAGEKRVGDPDDFGMISLLLVLGERLPFPEAWAAVSGWKGDASIGYRSEGKDCIRVQTQLDSSSDGDEFEQALRAWSQGLPTTTTRVGPQMVQFSSCDPGTSATVASVPGRPRTFSLLALRSQLVSSLAGEGLPAAASNCVADDVLRTHDPAKLLELDTITDENDPRVTAIQRDVVQSVIRCRR
jgi:hypothetical protein